MQCVQLKVLPGTVCSEPCSTINYTIHERLLFLPDHGLIQNLKIMGGCMPHFRGKKYTRAKGKKNHTSNVNNKVQNSWPLCYTSKRCHIRACSTGKRNNDFLNRGSLGEVIFFPFHKN